MNYYFKGELVVLPEGFILKKEGKWHRLYHRSKKDAITGISSECTVQDFKERVNLHIENYLSYRKVLEPALS